MKKSLLIVLLVLSSTVFSQKKDDLQRYQIVEVEALVSDVPLENTPYDFVHTLRNQKMVIKIDTQTGNAWRLVLEYSKTVSKMDSLGVIRPAILPVWCPIENYDLGLPDLPPLKKK